MAEDRASGLQLAAERALAVRQIEGELVFFHADGHSPPDHVGGVRRSCALKDQRAAGKRPEPPLRFPQAREVVRRSGGSCKEQKQDSDPERSDFGHQILSFD
jgi:hypothetical protein